MQGVTIVTTRNPTPAAPHVQIQGPGGVRVVVAGFTTDRESSAKKCCCWAMAGTP